MPDYRLYFLTPDDHIKEPPTIVECDDDAHALAEAARLLGPEHSKIEVWEGQRAVGKLSTAGTQMSGPQRL